MLQDSDLKMMENIADFLMESIKPIVADYSDRRVLLVERLEASIKAGDREEEDEASAINYRDYLFDCMIQSTAARLGEDLAMSVSGKPLPGPQLLQSLCFPAFEQHHERQRLYILPQSLYPAK